MKLREGNVFTGVCLSRVGGYIWSHVLSGGEGGYLWYQVLLRGMGMSRGWLCLGVGMSMGMSGGYPTTLGHGSMGYSWQVGGKHPTGMVSCGRTVVCTAMLVCNVIIKGVAKTKNL